MAEADLQERHHSSNLFAFESQSLDSQGSCGNTGLISEDALIEEAVSLNELSLMGSMLLSLIKFDTVSGSTGDLEAAHQLDDQRRNQLLTELKRCDESL